VFAGAAWSCARGVALMAFLAGLGCSPAAGQQEAPVTIQVNSSVQSTGGSNGTQVAAAVPASGAVVWLTRREATGDTTADGATAAAAAKPRPRITQHNKQFEPHLLVVQVGTVIEFPNRDPFFHNVFSQFDGKRFDLGLYEAGSTNSVKFDRLGVSFLFCNIHPEMSAVVVTVDTPYYAVADRSGRAVIANVPDGSYDLHVWSERAVAEDMKKPKRTVVISATNRNLPPLLIANNPNFTAAHKNKYGQDYVPPDNNGYSH
jgi:plastocyanin